MGRGTSIFSLTLKYILNQCLQGILRVSFDPIKGELKYF
ncbi:hypothetical protein M595_1532 [Lyngbya aestuarii BL J]|uniref:Uncharacterized protein n=1 Tax=Lyngbya aestuarii BL J TaxID=1348334 RepID=U7QPY6_9CYAN|nr:hypothetical protein M595_1532 [Lyngbya aestuarii BL J]